MPRPKPARIGKDAMTTSGVPYVKHKLGLWLARKHMTQKRFAAMVPVSETYLTLILNGEKCPSLPLAKRLEALTGIGASLFCPERSGRYA